MTKRKSKARPGAVPVRQTESGLNPQRERFVREYLKDLNATQAAMRAGYSRKGARVTGHRLLTDAAVAAAIQQAMDRRAERTEITTDRILTEIARLALVDHRKFFDAEGKLKPIKDLDEDAAAALAGFEVEESADGKIRTKKIRTYDKVRSLELLGKHRKLFTDRHEHTGPDGGPIQHGVMFVRGPLSPEEWLAQYGQNAGGSSSEG